MRSFKHALAFTLLSSILLSSAAAFAATSPYVGANLNLPFTATNVDSSGNIFGYTTSTDSNGYTIYNYYTTNVSGTTVTSLGSVATLYGSPQSHYGSYLNPFSLSSDQQSASYNNTVSYDGAIYANTLLSDANSSNLWESPQVGNFLGYTSSGSLVGNLNFGYDQSNFGQDVGAITNGTTTTYTQLDTFTGMNASGNIAITGYNIIGGSPGHNMFEYNNGSVVQLSDLGYGGITTGVNSTGQVTGGLFQAMSQMNPPNYQTLNLTGITGTDNIYSVGVAFKTGANGVGTQAFGTANGVESQGTVINSAGQVGGYIVLANNQTEAFLSTARGGLMVGLGAGAATDSTTVAFLNDNGQAIIYDSTTNTYYLYSAGVIVPVSSLTNGNTSAVIGFNNNGDIILQDPTYYTVSSASDLSASTLSGLSGAVSLSSTSVYQAVSAAQGGATPTSTFYTDPAASTSTISLTSVGGSGVPGPATGALLALALLGSVLARRKILIRPPTA